MPPFKIERDHIGERVIASERFESWLDASLTTRAIAIAAIKYRTVEKHDQLMQPVCADFVDKLMKLSAIEARSRRRRRTRNAILAYKIFSVDRAGRFDIWIDNVDRELAQDWQDWVERQNPPADDASSPSVPRVNAFD